MRKLWYLKWDKQWNTPTPTKNAIIRHCKHVVKNDVPCKSGTYTDKNGENVEIVRMTTLSFIPESDLYRLILKSQLPSAERFEDWIVEEVLPSIRKKWYYGNIDRKSPSNFILRYDLNFGRIEPGYFSVISELHTRVFSNVYSSDVSFINISIVKLKH